MEMAVTEKFKQITRIKDITREDRGQGSLLDPKGKREGGAVARTPAGGAITHQGSLS